METQPSSIPSRPRYAWLPGARSPETVFLTKKLVNPMVRTQFFWCVPVLPAYNLALTQFSRPSVKTSSWAAVPTGLRA